MFKANSEQAAIAWLNTLEELFTLKLVHGVATKLPDMGKVGPNPVFLVCSTVTGSIDPTFPTRSPYIQIDAFAKPGLESTVLNAVDIIRDATYNNVELILDTKTGYNQIKLSDVTLRAEPRLIRTDPAKLARAIVEVELTYVDWEES